MKPLFQVQQTLQNIFDLAFFCYCLFVMTKNNFLLPIDEKPDSSQPQP
jgi:hypothetical protein